MIDTMPVSEKAARLVYKALQPTLTPTNEREYRDLLSMYEADAEFRTAVQQVVEGFDLQVLSITHRGAVIVPRSGDSRFAYRLQDIRSGMPPEDKALLVLIHITIAALFYPTTEKLNDDGYSPRPLKETETLSALKSLCQDLSRRSPEELIGLPRELEPGWQCVLVKPEARPEQQRKTTSTLEGLVARVFAQLRDNGLVRLESEQEARYTATWRYTVQLREMAVSTMFEAGRKALAEREVGNA